MRKNGLFQATLLYIINIKIEIKDYTIIKYNNMMKRNKDTRLSTIYSRCLITRNVILPITEIGSNIKETINIVFVVVFECRACFPVEGTLISCIAKNITKAGIRAESSDEIPSPIVVFIARDHHYNSEQFNEIKEGDKFTARVIGQRFELNDKYVSIIAELKVDRNVERKQPFSNKKGKGATVTKLVLNDDVDAESDSDSDNGI